MHTSTVNTHQQNDQLRLIQAKELGLPSCAAWSDIEHVRRRQQEMEKHFGDRRHFRELKLALELPPECTRQQAVDQLIRMLHEGRIDRFCTILRKHILTNMPVADGHDWLRLLAKANPLYGARLQLFADSTDLDVIRAVAVMAPGETFTLLNQIRTRAVPLDPYKVPLPAKTNAVPGGPPRLRPVPSNNW